MEIKIISNIEELKYYRQIWYEILKENNCDIPFIQLDWIDAWWRFLGSKHQLYIIVTKHNDTITGFFPLMITKRILFKEINFIGYPQASYMDFILLNEYRKESIEFVINFLLKETKHYIFNLQGLFLDSSNYRILINYFTERNILYFIRKIKSFPITIKGKDFYSYLKRRRVYSSIRTMINSEKRLKEYGNLIYDELCNEKLDKIFLLHDKRWKKKNDTSKFSSGRVKEFFNYLALNKNLTFKTHIAALWINTRIIAFVYGFQCNGRYLFYKMAHDDDFAIFGAGKIIIKELIRECFDAGISIFDFCIGDERYKSEWTDEIAYSGKLIFSSYGIFSKVVFLEYSFKEKLIGILKENPYIVGFIRNTLGKIKYSLSYENLLLVCKKLRYEVQQKGLAHLIKIGIEPILKRMYKNKEYIIFEKKNQLISTLDLCKNFSILQAGLDDLSTLSQFMNVQPIEITKRFNKNHKCFITLYNSQIIHCAWVDLLRISVPDIAYAINIEKNESYIYDSFTDRMYRDKDVDYYALLYITKFLYARNYTHFYTALSKRDKASIKTVSKCGFMPKYSVKMSKLFHKDRYIVKKVGKLHI